MDKLKIKQEIIRILEGWFGESLEDSDQEDSHRKYLYEPLLKVIDSIPERKV
jgi:hypothetical protein